MKYYLISIQKLSDGTSPVGIYGYDTQEAVLSAYHSTLASNYVNYEAGTLLYFCTSIIDEQSNVLQKEHRYKENVHLND